MFRLVYKGQMSTKRPQKNQKSLKIRTNCCVRFFQLLLDFLVLFGSMLFCLVFCAGFFGLLVVVCPSEVQLSYRIAILNSMSNFELQMPICLCHIARSKKNGKRISKPNYMFIVKSMSTHKQNIKAKQKTPSGCCCKYIYTTNFHTPFDRRGVIVYFQIHQSIEFWRRFGAKRYLMK